MTLGVWLMQFYPLFVLSFSGINQFKCAFFLQAASLDIGLQRATSPQIASVPTVYHFS